MASQATGFVAAAGSSTSWWFFDTRMTVLVGREQTAGLFTLIEFQAAAGFSTPRHVHRVEDEAFLVHEGALRVVCGDDEWYAESGSVVFLPRCLPHSFVVVSREPVVAWQITTPAGFEDFVAALGEPARGSGLPPTTEPNVPKLIDVAGAHGIDIVGPLLPPDSGSTSDQPPSRDHPRSASRDARWSLTSSRWLPEPR